MQTFLKACREYNALYEEAVEFLRDANPCTIGCQGCIAARLDKKRNLPDKLRFKLENGLCCRGCPYLGPNGCTQKALTCRVWLCGDAFGALTEHGQKQRLLNLQFRANNFAWSPRGNKMSHIRQHLGMSYKRPNWMDITDSTLHTLPPVKKYIKQA